MKIKSIINLVDKAIPIKGYEKYPKILVTGKLNQEVEKIGFALDFVSYSLEKAKQNNCKLLLVHHGPPNYDPWESKVTQEKIKYAKKLGITVYTLPLCYDASSIGSNANFTRMIDIETEPVVINFQGTKLKNAVSKIKQPITHKDLIKKLKSYPSSYIKMYGKIKQKYANVIFAAGGGFQWNIIEQTEPEVFISGDLNIRALRLAWEKNIILIELTHSSMENFTIKLAAKQLQEYLPIPVIYIKEPEYKIKTIK